MKKVETSNHASKEDHKETVKESDGMNDTDKIKESGKNDGTNNSINNGKNNRQLSDALAKQKEYLDALQRLQAEFDNYRKRTDKENQEFREYASKEFARKLLPVLDSFELAFKASSDPAKFLKGIELIYAQLTSALGEMGLKKIECMNQKFDPYRHEVLMVDEKSKHKDDTVVEEFQKGYLWKDHVLRHSKVKIAKSSSGNGCECSDDEHDEVKQSQKGSDDDLNI